MIGELGRKYCNVSSLSEHTQVTVSSQSMREHQDFDGIVKGGCYITIRKWYFHLLQTRLKPRDLTGGPLAGYVADRHRGQSRLYLDSAQRLIVADS